MARRQGNRQQTGWNFFSFPTLYGVAAGAMLATLLIGLLNDLFLVFTLSLFFLSFGTAHLITHTWRQRRLENQIERAEEDERERRIVAARNAAQREANAGQPPQRRRRRRRSS